MTVSLEAMLAEESAESRERIHELVAAMREELNLREMRRLRKLTQARLSRKLKIGQEGVSRMEKRTDLYLSTLRSYVEGVGGKLSLVVEFPDRAPVLLTGLGEPDPPVRRQSKARPAAKAAPKHAPKPAAKPKAKLAATKRAKAEKAKPAARKSKRAA